MLFGLALPQLPLLGLRRVRLPQRFADTYTIGTEAEK